MKVSRQTLIVTAIVCVIIAGILLTLLRPLPQIMNICDVAEWRVRCLEHANEEVTLRNKTVHVPVCVSDKACADCGLIYAKLHEKHMTWDECYAKCAEVRKVVKMNLEGQVRSVRALIMGSVITLAVFIVLATIMVIIMYVRGERGHVNVQKK